MTEREERGSATVLVVVMVAVLVTAAVASAGIGGVLVARRQAASAADLAALAGAEVLQPGGGSAMAGPSACAVSRAVAEDNGAQMSSCQVAGQEVLVEVEVEARVALGRPVAVTGRARAGPSEAVSSSVGRGP